MELIPLAIAIAAIVAVCLVGYGAFLGWNASVRKFGRNAANMQAQFNKLDEVAQKDPARLGIDIGKQYATQKMRDTLDDLDGEIT